MVKGWVEEIESEIMRHLRAREGVSLEELATAMRVSELRALSYISMLVRQGKVTIGDLGVRGN